MTKKPLFDFGKFIENRIANIRSADNFAFASAVGVGPWLVPLGPAIIFGYALYKSAPVDMAEFRVAAAVSVAIGLIVAGAVSSHNAIVAGGVKPWSLVVGYIALEIVGLWLMSVSFDVKIVGTVASLLTLIVYLSRSSAKEIDTGRVEATAEKRLKLDYQMEQARLEADHRRAMADKQADLKHAEKMARIEAKQRVTQGVTPVSHPETGVTPAVTPETQTETLLSGLRQPGVTMTQLADTLGVSRPTLYRRLNKLVETGEVVKNGNGYEAVK